jgi:hypothetical protein
MSTNQAQLTCELTTARNGDQGVFYRIESGVQWQDQGVVKLEEFVAFTLTVEGGVHDVGIEAVGELMPQRLTIVSLNFVGLVRH